ncbi:MAG: hypothetical protein ACTSWR_05420 [Candidatus Helarchaeota archaeon]
MSTPTKKSEKWLSDLGKSILILSENGILISEIVNKLQKRYNSKQTCWASISRTCRILANKNLLELFKKNNRVESVQTTLKGKQLIRDLCTDLEIIAINQSIKKYRNISENLKEKLNFSNNNMELINSYEIKKLILEILAKYGELTLTGISQCVDLPTPILSKILDNMKENSLILQNSLSDKNDYIKYQINWKYLFLPIKNINKK